MNTALCTEVLAPLVKVMPKDHGAREEPGTVGGTGQQRQALFSCEGEVVAVGFRVSHDYQARWRMAAKNASRRAVTSRIAIVVQKRYLGQVPVWAEDFLILYYPLHQSLEAWLPHD